MPVITCIDDLKRLYRRRVPRMFYDYAESGQLDRTDLSRKYLGLRPDPPGVSVSPST